MAVRMIGDRAVSGIGLGAMTLTQVEGYDEVRSLRTIHAALDAGVTLVDTADAYGPGGRQHVNEEFVARALATWSGDASAVLLATKGGHVQNPNGTWWVDGSPAHLRKACEGSLRRLGLDVLPLYQHHRPDPKVPYEETMGAMRQLHDEGLVARVGISNADEAQIRAAHAALGAALVSVQNEHSPAHRGDREIDLCAELGLAYLAYSPFGGMRAAKNLGAAFVGFAKVAEQREVSPQQVCLAWQLHRAPHLVPIPGASRPESILDSIAALELRLTSAELAVLDRDGGTPQN
ncbi:aldo/keto reductase [Nocardioides sp. JQ2195]|nr:aldo/keto reductase [Nocardioides sp. JQ2195]